MVLRVGIQTGPNRCSTNSQPSQTFRSSPDSQAVSFYRPAIGFELLPQSYRDGILQMRAPGFKDILEFFCLDVERSSEVVS